MKRFTLQIDTEGNGDVINLTPQVAAQLQGAAGDGIIHLMAIGSTLALTTLEFEPGLVRHDLKNLLQRLIPDDARYEHEATWNDDNGHSHLRAALIGADITLPFGNGRVICGEYQQIVLVDFDTRPRRRSVVGTILP